MRYVSRFETVLGTGFVVASEIGICRVQLPGGVDNDLDSACKIASPLTEQASRMLELYFKGRSQQFELLPVDLSSLTVFRARILLLIRQIPPGTARSYGEVASMAGIPGAARAVGGAMAANPVPVIIPCHRIVAGNGNLTGFTAPGGISVKKKLLELEGLEIKGGVAVKKTAVINKTKLVSKENK
ncbi:MAG TPA: methylated-DNA--[protein]-cysteine S-methyltransferase [Desulfuromonadaceae bacterium]|jgi:methylated-DNA-[protein]-cysteine S-methyltransferase